MTLWGTRASSRAGLLVWLFVLAGLLLTFLLGANQVLTDASARALSATIGGAPVDDRTVLAQTRVGDQDQDAAARQVISQALPGIEISSAVRTPALPIVGSDQRLTLAVDPDAVAAADLLEGAWPAATGEASLNEAAAQYLELGVGDTLAVSADGPVLELEIVGLWRPADPDASIWGQDTTSRTGVDTSGARAFGPALVEASTIAPAATEPFAQWRLLADAVTAEEVSAWQSGLPTLADQLEAAGVTVRGLTLTGDLATTLDQAAAGLAAVRGVTPIALMLLGLIGGIATWQILRLLGQVRERETVTLTARGASRWQFLAWGLGEGLVVALPAAGLAWVVVVFGLGGDAAAAGTALGALGAVSVVLAVVAAWRASGARLIAGRAEGVIASFATLAIAGFAAFTGWRLLRNGTPLVPGTTRIDLLAVTAPAAVVLTIAAVGALSARPLLRVAGVVAARRPGLSPVTELRFASRRSAHGLLIILVALFAASATLAAGYLGSWQSLRTTAAQVADGAAVVVTGSIDAATLATYRDLPGVDAAAGVYSSSISTDTGSGQLTALTRAGYAAAQAPGSVFDRGLADALDPDTVLTGIDLPAGSASLDLTVTAAAKQLTENYFGDTTRSVGVFVWLWDGDAAVRLDAGELQLVTGGRQVWDFDDLEAGPVFEWGDAGIPVTRTLTVDLPVTGSAWRIIAVDTVNEVRSDQSEATFAVDALAVDGAPLDLAAVAADFAPDTLTGPEGTPTSTGPLAYEATFADTTLDGGLKRAALQRFMPTRAAPAVVPIATTPGWTGPETEAVARIAGAQIRVDPVAQVPVIPGNPAPSGALADFGAIVEAVLRDGATRADLGTAWVATEDDGVADEIAAATPAVQVHPASGSTWTALSGLAPALFAGIGGLGLVLLIPALVGAGLSELRERRGEVVVMRALGASARAQAASRRRELAWLAAGAAVFGVGAGVLTSWLLVPPLIRATTPQVSLAIPLRLAFDPLTLGVGVAASVAVFAGFLWWYGRGVAAQVTDTMWREDVL